MRVTLAIDSGKRCQSEIATCVIALWLPFKKRYSPGSRRISMGTVSISQALFYSRYHQSTTSAK
jgi:hypothetical protein